MARTLGYLFVAGGMLGLASLILPMREQANVTALLALVGVALASGALLVLQAERLPGVSVPFFLALANVQIALAVHFDGRGGSVYG
ncbi:MAG TPA: hypothetical protein VIM03_07030, partial [Thermoleophilaceae bacterium]